MELTEQKLFEVFGVEPEQAPGGNEPEPADQVTDAAPEQTPEPEPDAGGREQEPANPATGNPEDGEQDGQTAEERRQNAARRRQQETQQAVNAAVQQARQQWEQERARQQETFFRQAGLVNPFNKQPITNMEEFNSWRQEQDEKKLQRELSSGKLTQETLNSLIDKHPAVQAAKKAQEDREKASQIQEASRFRRDVEQQLAEIRKTDPSINEVGDLMNRPYSKDFYAAVQRGNNFLDAFTIATRNQQVQQQAAAAQQAAINNIRSKDHLKRTGTSGTGGATVTAEDARMFRVFNPTASDKDIQEFMNRQKKG